MRKPVTRLLTAVVVLIALLIAVPAAVYILLPKDRVRRILVSTLEAKLARPVHIGAADYAFLPRIRLRLDDVRVGGPAAPGAPRLSASRVRFGMRLLPLIHRQVVVTGIEIDHPEVEMVLQGPEAPAGAPAASTPVPAQPVGLQVQDFRISDGMVDVRLPGGAPLLHLGGVSEDLKASLEHGIAVLSGTTGVDTLRLHMVAGDFGQGLRLRFHKRLRYDIAAGRLDIDQASLDLAGVPVAVSGNVTGLSSPQPVLDLSLHGGPGNLSDIAGLVPARLLPGYGRFRSSGTLAVEGTVQGPAKAAGFRVTLALDHGRIESDRLPAPVQEITLHLRADPDNLDLETFAAKMGGSALQANAVLAGYRQVPQVRANLRADLDLASISGLYVPRDSLDMTGRASAQLTASGSTADPGALQVNGTASISGASFRGAMLPAPLEGVDGDLTFDQRSLDLRALTAKFGSSDFKASGTLNNYQALEPGAKVAGRTRADLRLQSHLINLDELFPVQRSGAKTQAGSSGAVPAALPPLDGTLAVQADRVVSRGIEATQASGTLLLDRGVVTIQKFGADAFGGQLGLNGSVDLSQPRAPRFDLAADGQGLAVAQIYKQVGSLDRFSRIGTFLSGRMQVHTGMKGALTDTLTIDPGSLTSDGNLQVDQAALSGYPVQAALASFLNAPQIKNLQISDWKESFHVEQGRLTVQGLSVNAGPIQITANGWFSLDGTMQMSADLLLPPELSAGLRSKVPAEVASLLLAPGTDRVFVPLQLDGRTESPRVGIDTGRLTAEASRQAEAKMQQERQRLQQEAGTQARQILQGVLGARSDSAGRADSTAKKLEQEARKRLGGILGK